MFSYVFSRIFGHFVANKLHSEMVNPIANVEKAKNNDGINTVLYLMISILTMLM